MKGAEGSKSRLLTSRVRMGSEGVTQAPKLGRSLHRRRAFVDSAGHYALVIDGMCCLRECGGDLEDIGWDASGTLLSRIALGIFADSVERMMSTSLPLLSVLPTQGCILHMFQAEPVTPAIAKAHSPDVRFPICSQGLCLEY